MEDISIQSKNSVHLRKILHNNSTSIGIYFDNLRGLNKRARETGAKWTGTFKCWYLPYNIQNYEAIKQIFKDCDIILHKEQALQSLPGLLEKRQFASSTKSARAAKPTLIINTSIKHHSVPLYSDCNEKEFIKYSELLALKGYSPSTQKTYKGEFSIFLQQIKNVNVQDMTAERLSAYFFYCHKYFKLSENTIHSRLNALKFYYEQVLKREKFFWEIPRPKKHLVLPKVISEEKIIAGITKIDNLKHKALIATAYSAGLRVSEVVNLKISDVNSDRMQIFIARAKGKKDRVVTLSSFALKILREYYKKYKPKHWLFEGQESGECYSSRSAQEIFKAACKRIGIPASMTFHSLRHSFATHLLENGTDIKYIQEILGHNDINTTLRYTHVSKKAIEAIESPLDKIARKMGL